MVGWIQIFWRKGLKLIKKIENEKTNKVNAIYAISKFDHIGRSISKILLCNKILSCYKIYNTIHMLFFWCGILHLYTFVNVNPHRSFVTVVLEYLKETEDNKSSVNLRWLSWPFDQPWMYWKNGFDIYLLNISRKSVFWYIFQWYIDISLIYQIGVYSDMLNSNLTINIHLIWTSHIIACTYSLW